MKKIDSSCSGDSVPNISKSCSSFSTRALKKQTENYINQPNNKEISTLAATTSRNGPEIVCRRRRAPACDFVVWLFFSSSFLKKNLCVYIVSLRKRWNGKLFSLFFFSFYLKSSVIGTCWFFSYHILPAIQHSLTLRRRFRLKRELR